MKKTLWFAKIQRTSDSVIKQGDYPTNRAYPDIIINSFFVIESTEKFWRMPISFYRKHKFFYRRHKFFPENGIKIFRIFQFDQICFIKLKMYEQCYLLTKILNYTWSELYLRWKKNGLKSTKVYRICYKWRENLISIIATFLKFGKIITYTTLSDPFDHYMLRLHASFTTLKYINIENIFPKNLISKLFFLHWKNKVSREKYFFTLDIQGHKRLYLILTKYYLSGMW